MTINKNQELTSDLVGSIKKFVKKTGYVASVVTIASVPLSNAVQAGDGAVAVTEVENSFAVTATDVNGMLVDANGTTVAGTIITNADITFGTTNDFDSITSASTGTAVATFTITDSTAATANTITFAGDITLEDNEIDDTLTIVNTNTNILIQNDVVAGNAANVIKFQNGSVGDASITVDHDVDEAQDINAIIDGNATNTVTLNISSTTANDELTTFKKAIGSVAALDVINIGTTDNETVAVTFDAAVSAATINIGDDANTAGDSADIIFEAQAADFIVTGTINQAVANDAVTLSVQDTTANTAADTVTFASVVGGDVAIDIINVGSATVGGDAIFNTDVSATTINILGGNNSAEDANINFKGDVTGAIILNEATGQPSMVTGGAAAQTITGAITTLDDDKGTLQVTNVTGVTFTGAIGETAKRMLEVTVNDAADTNFMGTVMALTLDIDTNATGEITHFDVAGSIVGNSGTNGGALQLAGGEITLGKTIGDGDVVIDTATTVASADGVVVATAGVTVTPFSNFTSGTIKLIDGDDDSMTTTEQGDFFVRSNLLTDFAVVTTAQDISITATERTVLDIAADLKVRTNESKSLSQVMAAAATDSALLTAVDSALRDTARSDRTADTKAFALQTAPQSDGITGSTGATRAMTGSVQGIVSNRMASLRSGDAYVTGMSAGNGMSANSGFIQAFGSITEQETDIVAGASIYGYDAETSGVAIGIDSITDNGSTLGLSASFSTTDVVGLGTGKSKNSIDSYTVSVYGDKATDMGYVEGSLTYGLNDNTGSRLVNVSGLNRSYTSNYDSQQLSLKVGVGSPNEIGDGNFVTPFGSITGTFITTDTYTETSTTASDSLRLKVDQDDVSSVIGSVGLKAHKVTNMGTPTISLSVNNEFGDNSIATTNSYTGGGTAFTTTSLVEELSATLGLGYSFGNDIASLNVGYEAEANGNEYISHYGSIKIVSKF